MCCNVMYINSATSELLTKKWKMGRERKRKRANVQIQILITCAIGMLVCCGMRNILFQCSAGKCGSVREEEEEEEFDDQISKRKVDIKLHYHPRRP